LPEKYNFVALASVHAYDEPAIASENFQQPLAARWKVHGQPRRRPGASRQNAHETDNVGSLRMARKKVVRQQPDDLPALADHDLRIEGKHASEFNAQLCATHPAPDYKGTRRADVHANEGLQLFRQRLRSEGSVPSDVDASQKNHECHELPPPVALNGRYVERARRVRGLVITHFTAAPRPGRLRRPRHRSTAAEP
jgi:hypothetical protein